MLLLFCTLLFTSLLATASSLDGKSPPTAAFFSSFQACEQDLSPELVSAQEFTDVASLKVEQAIPIRYLCNCDVYHVSALKIEPSECPSFTASIGSSQPAGGNVFYHCQVMPRPVLRV